MSGRQAFLNDVAHRLGVTPAQLSSALNGAFKDQLDAAVKAGKLTQAQANAIKQWAQGGGAPPAFGLLPGGPRGSGPGGFAPRGLGSGGLAPGGFGGSGRFGPGGSGPGHLAGPGGLGAAATYLGLTETQLFNQLSSGKSLAQIVKAHGKTSTGLEQAMLAAIRSKLAQAAADKDITSAQEKQILSQLSARLSAEINGTAPGRGFLGHINRLPRAGADLPGPPGAGPGIPGPAPGPRPRRLGAQGRVAGRKG